MKKAFIITLSILVVLAGGLAAWFFLRKNTQDMVLLPYISHQKPRIDPHLPSSAPMADKLDEVLFDGLFNVSSNPSGIVYENGLGELVDVTEDNVVTVKLHPSERWHSSYNVFMDKNDVTITEQNAVTFVARDLNATLRRIQRLGSLSPDYILVSQAIDGFSFSGPDQNDQIQLKFKDDRMWTEADIKEVLSFKVIPHTSDAQALQYHNGTGPYLLVGEQEDEIFFHRNPKGSAQLQHLVLKPFIDNSTFSTELKNRNINVLLDVPFGCVSPILSDTGDFFYKPSISTCFFALFCNTQRLSRGQRQSLRQLVDRENLMYRFFKVNTQQQRHIVDYRGNANNYEDYLNYSVFPTTSYYVEEKIVMPLQDYSFYDGEPLPDTVRIQTSLNYGYREELAELVDIMNDPTMFGGKLKVTAVQNEELRRGAYDAVLLPVTGYRSNFLFDLYDVFLREPDLSTHSISLRTTTDRKGNTVADAGTFRADGNFFRLDLSDGMETEDKRKLLEYIYGFMSTSHIGDKQAYAQMIDELDQEMALGVWLFSMPSLAYFRTQFDDNSINLYGVSSQLSTIEHWRERNRR